MTPFAIVNNYRKTITRVKCDSCDVRRELTGTNVLRTQQNGIWTCKTVTILQVTFSHSKFLFSMDSTLIEVVCIIAILYIIGPSLKVPSTVP